MTIADERVLTPDTDIDSRESDQRVDSRTDPDDPDLEKPYYDEPIEDPETEDDIINGADDDPDEGLPLDDESEPRR